ncbi:MAG: hypothetical protein KJJ56_10150 [Serratia rubidaea]|nr:hypothetical protein [Serratia rubidaea]
MDYDGLMIKYKNRASPVLVADELNYQLYQHQAIDLNGRGVMDDAAVIHFSSGYMEIVDKWYSIKGFLTVVALSMLLLFGFGVLYIPYNMFKHFFLQHDYDVGFYVIGVIAFVVSSVITLICYLMLRVECFRWTHYPVRFDRKTGWCMYFLSTVRCTAHPGTRFFLPPVTALNISMRNESITIYAGTCWQRTVKRY